MSGSHLGGAMRAGLLASLPAAPPAAAATDHGPGEQAWVRTTIRQVTPEDEVGQLFVPYLDGVSADDPDEILFPFGTGLGS